MEVVSHRPPPLMLPDPNIHIFLSEGPTAPRASVTPPAIRITKNVIQQVTEVNIYKR